MMHLKRMVVQQKPKLQNRLFTENKYVSTYLNGSVYGYMTKIYA